jgi:hypothetical protein
MKIAEQIRETIDDFEDGKLFTAKEFEHLNDDDTVRRTLSRLQKNEVIVRVATGLYIKPKLTQFGMLLPTIDQIANKIAERDKAQIMPTGDTALNILGLSTQVPMNAVYLTNGTKRKVKIGNRNIVFRNVAQSNFQFEGKLLPLIIIALRQLGEDNIDAEIIVKITELLQKSDEAERKSMLHDLYLAPEWIKKLLLPII